MIFLRRYPLEICDYRIALVKDLPKVIVLDQRLDVVTNFVTMEPKDEVLRAS